MRALLIQRGCEATLEVLPANMEAQTKAELNKKAHSAMILCLASYEYFVDTLLYGQEALTLKDVMATLNSKEIKERSKAKEDDGEGLYVRRRTDRRDSRQSRGKLRPTRLDYVFRSSYYMTPRLDILFDFLECNGGSVQLGDNRECKTRGIGKVRVQLRDESSFVLHNVRYIPELKRNLISLGTLKKEGYTVKLQSGKVKVINGSRVILFGIRRDNCVYTLNGNAMEGELNASVDEKDSLAQVWHKRLGHISEAGLQVLEKQGLFGKKSLGSDRLCSFRLMRSVSGGIIRRFKHEAFRVFKEWKHLVENQTGRTVKKLRSDNGLEFCNREFEQLCIESGIARHLTVAGMPQQNEVAGRMNKTLMDKVDYFLIQSGLPKTFWTEAKYTTAYLINRLNNHTPEEDQTDQEDGNDEDAGDQATDQPPDLTYYQLVRDREPKTRTKPLRFRDESNMASCEGSSKWKVAMKEEMDSFRKNKTWELVDHPAGQKLVSYKWLFKIKEGIEGVQKPRYKARLVARGFTQRAGIDYNEVYSLIVRHTSIRVILALTACNDYELEHLDVKTAFLHGNLEEMIHMRQPPRYEQPNKLRQLRMSYAPGDYIYLLLYVDDMLIACKSKTEIGSTKSLLKKKFDMKKLGEAKNILSMEIVRDRSRKILRVLQSGYVSKILNNFRIDNEKSVKMLLVGHFKQSLKACPVRDCDVERMSNVPYANAVRSLMYLMEAVNWILKYLRGTKNVGLVYGTNRGNHVDVTGFVDSDYAKDLDKGRDGVYGSYEGCEGWLRGLLEEWGIELNTVAVNCDNQGAIHLSRDHVFHERTKHINVRYHFIRKVLEANTVKVLKVGTEHNVAYALTKVVPGLKLQHYLELLNVVKCPKSTGWNLDLIFIFFVTKNPPIPSCRSTVIMPISECLPTQRLDLGVDTLVEVHVDHS
nr:hypothetical protein [Tanacetum cinerariifolium]